MIRRPPRSPLFPSTPLSRSRAEAADGTGEREDDERADELADEEGRRPDAGPAAALLEAERAEGPGEQRREEDRKSTRLNSSHANISYAVFCLKKKKNTSPA